MARPPDQSFDGLMRDKDASQIILRRARNNAFLEDGDPLKRSPERNEELIAVTQRQLFLLTEDVTGTAGQTNGKALVASFNGQNEIAKLQAGMMESRGSALESRAQRSGEPKPKTAKRRRGSRE